MYIHTLRMAGVKFPKQEAWMIHRRGGAGDVALLNASFDGAMEKPCPHPWFIVLLGSPRRVVPEPLKESQFLINYRLHTYIPHIGQSLSICLRSCERQIERRESVRVGYGRSHKVCPIGVFTFHFFLFPYNGAIVSKTNRVLVHR